jgi:transposase
MFLATAPIPDDPIALRMFALSLQHEIAVRDTELKTRDVAIQVYKDELYNKTLYIEKLKAQLAALRRARFGRSSEKLDRAIEQMELQLGDLEESHAEGAARLKRTTPQPSLATQPREETKSERRSLPEHLPRERVEHEAACACPNCGGKRLSRIGTDEREVLEYVPSHFKVIVHSRPKMSCRDCEKITQEPMPSLPIIRGMPGPGLLAHILIARFDDHLPYYRQSEIYARDGVELDRSTLAEWVGQMANLIDPLADAIGKHVRAGQAIHADDTPVPVLDPGRGKTKVGRLWVAVRDERPWGSGVPPAVFYRYSPDRKGEQAGALLADCTGYLHADAYAGFKHLYEPDLKTGQSRLLEVSCWAHARRYIYEVHKKTPSPVTHELLERIGELFTIEADIRGQSPDQRLKARTEQAIPRLAVLKTGFEAVLNKISGKSTLAEALRYSVSRWSSLTRYTTDGRLDICNNAAERAIRPIAIGRKNWMFAGSDDGGRRAAIAYTLIETAKLNGIEPEAYLRNIIGRIADHPARRIDELLPWNWSPREAPVKQAA